MCFLLPVSSLGTLTQLIYSTVYKALVKKPYFFKIIYNICLIVQIITLAKHFSFVMSINNSVLSTKRLVKYRLQLVYHIIGQKASVQHMPF